MTDAWGSLHIDVVDDEIIVTLPFTIYTVTYYKPPNSPQLLAKNFPSKDDPRVPLSQAEFLARAWRVATDKARELGWIEGKIPKPAALLLRGNLRIEVRDDEIVVTLPGTSYRAVYHKPADKPGLMSHVPFRPVGAGHPDDASRVSRSGLEARQRQGPRAGVDCVIPSLDDHDR
jgi:hypothetical protein